MCCQDKWINKVKVRHTQSHCQILANSNCSYLCGVMYCQILIDACLIPFKSITVTYKLSNILHAECDVPGTVLYGLQFNIRYPIVIKYEWLWVRLSNAGIMLVTKYDHMLNYQLIAALGNIVLDPEENLTDGKCSSCFPLRQMLFLGTRESTERA